MKEKRWIEFYDYLKQNYSSKCLLDFVKESIGMSSDLIIEHLVSILRESGAEVYRRLEPTTKTHLNLYTPYRTKGPIRTKYLSFTKRIREQEEKERIKSPPKLYKKTRVGYTEVSILDYDTDIPDGLYIVFKNGIITKPINILQEGKNMFSKRDMETAETLFKNLKEKIQ